MISFQLRRLRTGSSPTSNRDWFALLVMNVLLAAVLTGCGASSPQPDLHQVQQNPSAPWVRAQITNVKPSVRHPTFDVRIEAGACQGIDKGSPLRVYVDGVQRPDTNRGIAALFETFAIIQVHVDEEELEGLEIYYDGSLPPIWQCSPKRQRALKRSKKP